MLTPQPTNYRPEIDGLRAISVLAVIFFHAGFDIFAGGFVGVDIFFVISGYLITSIIYQGLANQSFSLRDFYMRRARRILPALFPVLLLSSVFSWFLFMPRDLVSFAESLISTITFTSNFLFWQESGYFGSADALKPLLHTWSLAVEEQYYILFPLFLMVFRSVRKPFIVVCLLGISIVSLLLAEWVVKNSNPSAAFYLLPTRGWELIAGGLSAIYLQSAGLPPTSQLLRQVLSALGLSLIVCSVFFFSAEMDFPGLTALLPVSGALLIVLYAREGTWVYKLLSIRILVGIGLISYSTYLWHYPLFAFHKYHSLVSLSNHMMLALSALAIVMGYLSWRFVEQPFRVAAIISDRVFLVIIVSLSAVVLLIATSLIRLEGAEDRKVYQQLKVLDYQPDNNVLIQERLAYRRDKNFSNYDWSNSYSQSDKLFDSSDPREKLLLMGNSHSTDLLNVLLNSEEATKNYEIARAAYKLEGLANQFFSSPLYRQADIVIIASRYNRDSLAELPEFAIRVLKDNKRLALVKNIYEFPFYGVRNYADMIISDALLKGEEPESLHHVVNERHYQLLESTRPSDLILQSNAVIDKLQSAHPELTVLDRMDYICDKNAKLCFGADDRLNKYFYDYGHHTVAGAKFFGRRVDQLSWLKPLDGMSQ